MTEDLFEAASPVAQQRQGSRPTNARSTHPQTKRSYRLRWYVCCDLCGRWMFGKRRRGIAYFACQREPQDHKDRADWYRDHPKSLWVREDALLDGVRHFFAERIFGPRRRQHLRDQLRSSATRQADSSATKRRTQLTRELTELRRRQDNLITRLKGFEPTGDADTDHDYRQSIQRRFAELNTHGAPSGRA